MLLTQTITALGVEPVTVADVKVSARLDDDITELDGQIATLITSTRLMAEHECERQFMPHTLRLSFDGWPEGWQTTDPLASLEGVQALGVSGWIDVAGFELLQFEPGRWCLMAPDALPELLDQEGDRVRVTVKVGCPTNVRSYIIAMAVHQLTTASAARPTNPPAYLAGLLDRERNWA